MRKAGSNTKAMGPNCLALSATLACFGGREGGGDSASGTLHPRSSTARRAKRRAGGILLQVERWCPHHAMGRAKGATSPSNGGALTSLARIIHDAPS
jgi:hypothetical protein